MNTANFHFTLVTKKDLLELQAAVGPVKLTDEII